MLMNFSLGDFPTKYAFGSYHSNYVSIVLLDLSIFGGLVVKYSTYVEVLILMCTLDTN